MPSITWEEFGGGSTPKTLAAHVTITQQRYISLNQAAYDLLGCPPAVTLLYDTGGQAIGLRAASEDTAYSHPVYKRGKGPYRYMVNAAIFLRFYGIDYSQLTLFKRVDFEDGTLILRFDQAYRKGPRPQSILKTQAPEIQGLAAGEG